MSQKTIDGGDHHMIEWMKAVASLEDKAEISHYEAQRLRREYMEDYKRENNGGRK